MNSVLRCAKPMGQQVRHGVCSPAKDQRELGAFSSSEVAQDEVGGIHPPRRAADPDPDPE